MLTNLRFIALVSLLNLTGCPDLAVLDLIQGADPGKPKVMVTYGEQGTPAPEPALTDWGRQCVPSDPGHDRSYHCANKVGKQCLSCCKETCSGCWNDSQGGVHCPHDED